MARHIRSAATIAALGLVASLGIAATDDNCYVALEGDPDTTEDDVLACEEQHWFHAASTLASNVGQVDATGTHGLPTFDTTPPAGSVTDGNGAGYLSWAGPLIGSDDGVLDAPFVGSYTGVLDRLDIDLHLLASTYDGLNDALGASVPHSIDIDLTVNGSSMVSESDIKIISVPEENSDAGSTRLDIAITGIAEAFDRWSIENGPDTVHEIELRVGPGPYGDQVYVVAFDTTEVPGGIGFNRVDLDDGIVVLNIG